MDEAFHTTLLNISKELATKNLSDMVFLCGKNLSEGEKESIKKGLDLFKILIQKNLLSKDNLDFLKELLNRISRKDILINKLKITETEGKGLEKSFKHISPYRLLLYNISRNIGTTQTEEIVYLLQVKFANFAEFNEKCMMAVLSEMEKQKNPEDILQILKSYLHEIGRADLAKNIETYEEEESRGGANVSGSQPDIQNNQSEEYKLDKFPHGRCVIVNNYDFNKARSRNYNLKDRDGTKNDSDKISRIFGSRGYEIKKHNDLTSIEIRYTIEAYAKEDHSKRDSFVCFILSHGGKGVVYGTDGEAVSIKELTCYFNGQKCSSLVGKPKIFFFQACQGNESDTGAQYVSDSSSSVYDEDATMVKSLPITADILTAFASVEDYLSLRSPIYGSIYIQNLCKVLQDPQFFKTDLTRILTEVQDMISKEDYQIKKNKEIMIVKQMPTYQSQLRKTLILPPPTSGQQ
ncbi:caspase-3-like isoform X2 [Leptodactylus fuscus]|uniref:caspase-3-like isoform X2 n=1 Tax=Leptodactylus fuscus TaxID=238119 RepID=UPI003F4F0BE7